MKVIAMIPARLESSRLPGKALIDIEGLPMVIHTCKRAMLARNIDAVYLATDSEKIREEAEKHGIQVIMTSSAHQTGSDRIAEAIGKVESDIVVNVQGDEPLLNPEHLERIVDEIKNDSSVKCALGVTPYKEKNRGSDIKAVLDLNNNVMYCSRTDLPSEARTPVETMLKMVFLVAFRTEFLRQYAAWKPTPLETLEYNEYLRILEHGERIRAVHLSSAKISVDTPEDLDIIRQYMKADTIRQRYM
ncbi:3-deoxy-manno-octulosonate cytidylyltransferase [Desulfovibrio subterraneus]|uniref:3-deoxy-manno-octulosonate cytidylyltransferase n=1 Tax=Desulfovibrio subterraneus TaxID=2718620 RepID=A0A7J0BN28_9BACT|nr:3-deoxy-manno-octulosonate cytidylyltransferase [Desulfovibrio subterraneus]WBF66114.1 3-deoxy-manno-octulosonate cytidylyltransferase [Desulfovibrio subterraneus]GFM35028.1 3-deoxy-manno-octulosonate cytidylyltransferase [Desulfovibrio subterraneus]